MISGLGQDVERSFAQLMRGITGIAPLVDVEHRCLHVPQASAISHDVVTEALSSLSDSASSRSRSLVLAHAAALAAIRHSRLEGSGLELIIGASTGATREGISDCISRPDSAIEPLIDRLTREPIGALGHQLGSELKPAKVRVWNSTVVSSACSSGALAIAIGSMRLEQGAARPQLVGGVDSLNLLTLCGFEALGAMAQQACRPFDAQRNGLSLGEGAGFLVLESEDMLLRRGAVALAWLDGYAIGSEAHHLTHPEVDGDRATGLIRTAIERASLRPGELGYVNAHGTATLANDAMECRALRQAIGPCIDDILVSSSKGQVGHTLAAAGAIEAVITVQALTEQAAPPTLGLQHPADDCCLKHVPDTGIRTQFSAALS
ncbi:MAG TPA: beta-ketoacyl synthase N-terminal-like domain-containing protein, partial [Polyangiaceae bacterium]